MKRTLWQITLASLLTLGAYIALSVLWRALLSGIQQPTLQLLLVCFMTTAAFGWFLLYTAKIRGSVGEEEVLDDYKEGAYGSLKDELRRVLRRERILLLCIAGIILLCFALNTFDQLVFSRKVISLPTFFFLPMYIFGTMFSFELIGYGLSALLSCLFYLAFLLLYRKKKYDYWMKKHL